MGRRGPGVLSRDMEVLLAQPRSGHCKRVRAYAAIIDPGVDPICARCGEEPEGIPSSFSTLLVDQEETASVSYTHLTLPTIYSV